MNDTRIKVLFTEDSVPLGGAEHILLQRLECLPRAEFDVYLLTLREKGVLLPAAQAKADHHSCVYRRVGLDPIAIMRLRRYLSTHAIDIVNTNQWLDSLYVQLASRGLAVKKVATVHGYNPNWRHNVNLRVLMRYHRVISVSQALRLDLLKMGLPWHKLAVVYNSCDPRFFLDQPAVTRNLSQGRRFRVACVAHFRWCRDHVTLIEAVGLMRARGVNIELELVGDGDRSLKARCEKLVAERELQGAITFRGERMVDAAWLSGFDLFVLPSLADTFGIAVLEAMACGVPVLVSDIPPLMDLIQHGHAGHYYEAGNVASCAEALDALARDPGHREELALRGRARADDFRPAKTTKDLADVYHAVIQDRT